MWGKCVRERESEEKETVRDGGGSKMRERGDNERERVGVVDGRVQCDAWDVASIVWRGMKVRLLSVEVK